MKKFLLIAVAVSSLLFASNVYAGGVTDDNNGNKGYILVSTGENNGANSVGHWTDSSFLKGDKGDTGETGATGQAGRDGVDGLNGSNGQDGTNGVDGQNGQDGANGINGLDGQNGQDGQAGINGQDGANGDKGDVGETGLKGEQGLVGQDGKQGDVGTTGEKGNAGDKGDEGKKGEQGLQGERGKGLEDRIELIGEVRLLDTKRTTWSVYAGRDVNNKVGIYGAKVTVKLGRSYEERRLDNLEARLNMLQPQTTNENIEVVPTTTGFRIKVNN